MLFAQNLEVRNSKLGFAPKAFRSTAKPVSPESIRDSWICREDFGIERNQSFKGDHGNAQFSLCCTSTAMPDANRKNRHPAFCFSFCHSERSRGISNFAAGLFDSVLKPRNVPHGKLPTTVALDQCVRELHDSIEPLAVRCSFHARFSQNNGYIIAVKPR